MKIIMALLLLLLAGAAGVIYPGPAEGAEKTEEFRIDDSLLHLREVGELGTDGQFISLLDLMGMKSDIQAPAKMRAFILQNAPLKMGMGAGYAFIQRKASLVWATGDYIIAGRREQVLQRLLASVKSLGLRNGDMKKTDSQVWTVEEGGLLHTITLAHPEELSINGQPACRTRLLWKLECSNIAVMPSLGRLTAQFPFMKDRRIDESFYRECGALDVEMLTLGPSARRSYDWEVMLVPPDKMKKGAFPAQIASALEKSGYVRHTSRTAAEIYVRGNSQASVSHIDGDEKTPGNGKIRILFQP